MLFAGLFYQFLHRQRRACIDMACFGEVVDDGLVSGGFRADARCQLAR